MASVTTLKLKRSLRAPAPITDPKAILEMAVQDYLDRKAIERGFDNIFTAVTYADEPVVPEYQLDGQAFRKWRSLVWAYCFTVLRDVQQGVRKIPTEAELLAELPPLTL